MFRDNPTLFYGIICLTVFLIVGLNISLFSMVKNNSIQRQIKATKNMVRKVQSPWEDEDKDLEELSRLVGSLQEQKPEEPSSLPKEEN